MEIAYVVLSLMSIPAVLVLSQQSTNATCPDPANDYLFDNDCFEFAELPSDKQMNHEVASAYCVSRNKTLAIIHSASQQWKVAERFSTLGWNRAMIGLRYQKSAWKWADNSPMPLRGQGCSQAKEFDMSKFQSKYSQTMSNDGCIAFCSRSRSQFAAVMAGSFCYCSSHFIWKQPASKCDLPCSGARDEYCGSFENSFVYYTAEFAFDNWQSGRPSVGGGCAALQIDGIDNEWKDSSCNYARPFLCRYDIDDKVSPRGVTEMACGNNDTCYYLYTNPPLNWYDANRFCSKSGGFLATIDSQERQDMVNTLVARLVNVTQVWIGAKNYDWYFADGTIPNFRGWLTADEPTFPQIHECAEGVVAILATTERPTFGWKSRPCSYLDGTPNRLVCSAPAIPGMSDFTSDPRARLMLPGYGSDGSREPDPSIGAPAAVVGLTPDKQMIPWWAILLIVLAAIVLVGALVAVVIIVVKQQSQRRTSPEVKQKRRRHEAAAVAMTKTTSSSLIKFGRDQTMLY